MVSDAAPPAPTPDLAGADGRLVLVTGAGRSGTSTVAGTLHYLGLHLPQPVIKPNESNPAGFFESTWPLWFHRRLMDQALVGQNDGRPEALEHMREAVTPEVRAELHEWLGEVAAEARQVVVKDPRSIWVPWLWAESAAQVGLRTGFVTMVRHPAEVLGSRATYYTASRDTLGDWRFSVVNLCGWINGNLVVERQTRDRPRVVLRYHDLVADWRSCMRTVRDTFDLRLDHDLEPGDPHRVDDFIDPALRRHEPSWDGLGLPEELVDIAEGVWAGMSALADADGADARARADLDALGARYESVVRAAQAISQDTMVAYAKQGQQKVEQETRDRLQAKLAKARAETRTARRELRETRRQLAAADAGRLRATYRTMRRQAGVRLRRFKR